MLVRRVLQTIGVSFSIRKLYSSLQLELSEQPNTAVGGASLKTVLEALVEPYSLAAAAVAPKAAPVDPEVQTMKQRINREPDNYYDQLMKETRVSLLGRLLWDWLDQLSEPVLRYTEVDTVCRSKSKNATAKFRSLDKHQLHTVFLLAAMIKSLRNGVKDESTESKLLDVLALRCLNHLTHSSFDCCLAGASADQLSSRCSTPASSVSLANETDAQQSVWSSNAVKLRVAHKKQLTRLFASFIQELKPSSPKTNDSVDNEQKAETAPPTSNGNSALPAAVPPPTGKPEEPIAQSGNSETPQQTEVPSEKVEDKAEVTVEASSQEKPAEAAPQNATPQDSATEEKPAETAPTAEQ